MIHGNACFVYFNKIWDIPCRERKTDRRAPFGTARLYLPSLLFLAQP